jgi:SecD/SecF fusion protein
MSPAIVFTFGLVLLALFGWYFATDNAARKRTLGLILTILTVAFCIEQVNPPKDKIKLGLDLQGGMSFLIQLVNENTERPITSDLLDQAVEVIRKRVDKYGVGEPVITPQGEDRILVQIPGLDAESMKTAREQLARVANLEFSIVHPNGEYILQQIESGDAIMPPGYTAKTYKQIEDGSEVEHQLLVKKRPDLSGKYVKAAYPFYEHNWGVILEFDTEGAKLFDNLAAQNFQQRLAIILDGEIQSAPTLQAKQYFGRASITGSFTEKEARNLASVLENPLGTPVVIQEERSVSPTLGADSIRSGFLAGVSGLALTVLFVLLYYRTAGVIAICGLLVNITLLFGMMAMFNFVLTLPGIAGIILTIGMAVDANVLIYERLREEMAAGKSLPAALSGAYDKAFSAIFDANVTTLITSVILFTQATGPVRGFAVTLTLGIIASMFSALLVTRTFFRWMVEKFGLTKLSMLDLIPKHKLDFLGKRWLAIAASLALILGSIATFAIRGTGNFGLDFRGGDLLIVNSSQPVTVAEARTAVDQVGLGGATVIQLEREGGVKEMLTFRSPEGSNAKILEALQTTYPDRGIVPGLEDRVGAQIGMEFAKRALWALGLGMLGILIYVTVRFEFSFALGAVLAVLHDVVITLGVFSLIGGELSLVMVGAVLTIAGYSINDTIVVFDRIREGLKAGGGGSIQTLMNNSINETLGRTILTGGTTILAVTALYFFGGAVLRDFAFAIIVGIAVGTYSSIFVATPIVLWWSRIRGKSIRREVLEGEALRQASRGAA